MTDPIIKPFPHNILRRESVEYPNDDYIEQDDYNEEEAWVYHTMSNVEDIVRKYGIAFMIEKLPRYTKIALIAHWRQHANTSGCSSTGD